MTEDDELDDRLRRLFAEDGLDLPVPGAAERSVVAGARRRRRRRLSAAAAGGMVAVAALVFATTALIGVGGPRGGVAAAHGPASSPMLTVGPESAQPIAPPTTPPTSASVLGPYGVGGVWLGMPARLAVRMAVGKSPVPSRGFGMPGCLGYAIFVPSPAPEGGPTFDPPVPAGSTVVDKPTLITVVISPSVGVVEMGGVTPLRTPQGIRLGMSVKQVSQTYRKVGHPNRLPATLLTGVPGNKAASYAFDVDRTGRVRSIWLRVEGDPRC